MQHLRHSRFQKAKSFTMVELLAVVAIMAVLISGAIYFTASYIQWAKNSTDKEICTVLNDELTRYKGGGGNIGALTLGAPMGDVFAALQSPVVPAGMPVSFSQQFMATNYTFPGRSLSAVGTGQQYHIARVDTYSTPDYLTSNTATFGKGATASITVNFTLTQITGSSYFGSAQGSALFAILNGTPGLTVENNPWPTGYAPWTAEQAKTWTSSSVNYSSYNFGQTMSLTVSGLVPGTYTLQLWDVGSGAPPNATYPWQVPPASQSITVSAGENLTLNVPLNYNTASPPAGNFYDWWVSGW